MAIVMRDVLVQNRPEVPRPGDQHPVGDLGPDGAHPALGISIGPGRHLHLVRTIGIDVSRVTHRFHPMFGQDLEFVVHRRNWGEDRVYLRDENGVLFSLPAAPVRP